MRRAALNVDITPVSPVEKGEMGPSHRPVRTDSCQKRFIKDRMVRKAGAIDSRKPDSVDSVEVFYQHDLVILELASTVSRE